MAHPLDAALADPWGALRFAVGDPLHPGGAAATATLLDRASVDQDTRLLDIGCGAGTALDMARERGARAIGLDRRPAGPGLLRGDLEALPLATASVDVVLAECVLCLAEDPRRAADEAARVLRPGGRLALSDVVVEGSTPDVPTPIEQALCLSGSRARADLVAALEDAGLEVGRVVDHRDDLLAMRDRAAARVDYERLLPAFGDRGREFLEGLERLEAAVESGRVGYVSLVARPAA